jgi:hypothetical protein
MQQFRRVAFLTGLAVMVGSVEISTADAATILAAPSPTGLGALGLLGWRRKKKAAALAA